MFRRLDNVMRRPVALRFEGREVAAFDGDTVASALLAAGVSAFRAAPASGAPRAPYCMMGACFECLMEVDGIAHRQTCLVPVRDGMTVSRQPARRDVGDAVQD